MKGAASSTKIQTKKTGNAANLTNAGRGRPKGVPNKTTAAVKDMVIQALDGAGGVKYLQKQADLNPSAFLTLVGKVIPLQVAGPGKDGEHVHRIIIEGVLPK